MKFQVLFDALKRKCSMLQILVGASRFILWQLKSNAFFNQSFTTQTHTCYPFLNFQCDKDFTLKAPITTKVAS